MSERVIIPAESTSVVPHGSKIHIRAAMTIDDMRQTVRNIAAIMPGSVWRELMDEINGEE